MIDPNDPELTAYLAYDAWGNNHAIVIEQLTEDYIDSLGAEASSGQITPIRNEAPILFERKGVYYLMYGPLCCFCHQGTIMLINDHTLRYRFYGCKGVNTFECKAFALLP